MTPVDYILAAIVVVSLLFGIVRGFLRESIALLGWLVGLWLAWRYAPQLQPYLGGDLRDSPLQIWVARVLLVVAAVTVAWLLGSLLGYVVQRSGLTLGVDRILGGVFGLVRGVVIVGFIVMLGEALQMQDEPWWKASKLLPLGREMASVLRGYVETGRQAVEENVLDS